MSSSPIADSARLALPADAPRIAEIQRRSWSTLADQATSQALLNSSDLSAMGQTWQYAILRPPDARCRVLVALADGAIVGFAVTAPSADRDAEPGQDGSIAEITVEPQARQRGHGSRLLNACADTLRADGFLRASIWVPSTDDGLRRFLAESGWAPDGAHQEIGTEDDQHRVKLVRLHADLSG